MLSLITAALLSSGAASAGPRITTDISCFTLNSPLGSEDLDLHLESRDGTYEKVEATLNGEKATNARYSTVKVQDVVIGRHVRFELAGERFFTVEIRDHEDTDYANALGKQNATLTKLPPKFADVEPTVLKLACAAASVVEE